METDAADGRFHRDLPPLVRKRDPPWGHASAYHSSMQPSWDPKDWAWNPTSFAARPIPHVSDDADEGLRLNLGAAPPHPAAAPVVRPAKRVRSGSPAGGNYPMCQVDDCRADLSTAKDYHRRHKVCEVHSKTTKAFVAKQIQRFCQQCSRFHLLSEFDEGKRSCRRRLAGHNRRRRKTQLEDASSKLLLTGKRDCNTPNQNLDILNLLSILAHFQGNGVEKGGIASAVPDNDRLISIIKRMNMVPSANLNGSSQLDGDIDLNMPQDPEMVAGAPERNGAIAGPLTIDLLANLSPAMKTSRAEATAASHSQGSSGCTAEVREKTNHVECGGFVNVDNQINARISPSGVGANACALRSSMSMAEHTVPEVRSTLPLQLFSSTDEDSPPKAGSFRNYLSSESSNPMEGRSPSSSPPVVRKFFPTNSQAEDATMVEVSTSQRWSSSFEFPKNLERKARNGVVWRTPYPVGYTSSSSGSDHSPSSSNSDAHDRTGRIMFKLFDKGPGDLPGTLRTEIMNWLSNVPTEMESHIRPGCIVLSLYLAMPSVAWDELKENFSLKVKQLLESDASQFWRSGRFLVYTNKQLASHKDGTIRFCKSWKSWSSPEVTSISPLAVVSGKETHILLRGRNLMVPGTKIHCTFMGGYTSKEVLCSSHDGKTHDDSSLETFSFPGGPPDVFGRCFIEVENGFKGNSFPLIIANGSICQELRFLESELENLHTSDATADEQGRGRNANSREDILRFLNELGWLFQRRNPSSNLSLRDFSCIRFKYLLIFSVERDLSSLTAKLLDVLAERSRGDGVLGREALDALLETQLLSRAVKRKCKVMVELLLGYSVADGVDTTRMYVFPPNLAGPGGLTPLHVAASCKGYEDMVDALTSDPLEIGLSCWTSSVDENGQSPHDYAAMANNHSYNELVERKVLDRKNNQVSIILQNENAMDMSWIVRESDELKQVPQAGRPSCAQCAVMEHRRMGGTIHCQGILRRPYIHSLLAIAAVCVCVCLFLRGAPQLGLVAAFKWENLGYGPQ